MPQAAEQRTTPRCQCPRRLGVPFACASNTSSVMRRSSTALQIAEQRQHAVARDAGEDRAAGGVTTAPSITNAAFISPASST